MAKSRRPQDPDRPVSDASPAAAGRQAIHGNHDADYGDRVSLRAYELYLERGRADGRDFDDWLTAERELTKAHHPRGEPRE